MIPYQLDPSLHAAPPEPAQLEDGFAPSQPAPPQEAADEAAPAARGLVGDKSPF